MLLKYSVVILSFLVFLKPQINFAQERIALQGIDDYPIHIEDLGSFYVPNGERIELGKYIFVVTPTGEAFIKINGDFVYLNYKTRTKTTNGYIDTFKGKHVNASVKINKIIKIDKDVTERLGVLKIKGSVNFTANVRGRITLDYSRKN